MHKNINIDTIKALRKKGKREQAEKMLKEYHEYLTEQRQKDYKEYCNGYNKNRIKILKQNSICISCGKRKAYMGVRCNNCQFHRLIIRSEPKVNYQYNSIGKDRFEVFKNNKLAYVVSLNPLHCDCKGFRCNRICKHIRFVLAQLEDKGGILKEARK